MFSNTTTSFLFQRLKIVMKFEVYTISETNLMQFPVVLIFNGPMQFGYLSVWLFIAVHAFHFLLTE
jgi:hypothetical protein